MLVLSRGPNDKVVFPTLGISVEILRIAGNKVRIGVDAPREIPVIRNELSEQEGNASPAPQAARAPALTHQLRNRLHTAQLGLHVLHKQCEQGNSEDAEAMIFKIFNELKSIEESLAPEAVPASTRNAPCRALLVEDDANESELMASYLRLSGIEVDTATDGLQAMMHLAKNERPDVVLMDMRMPRFNGEKAVATIRANPDYRGLKVFAVSGTERSETGLSLGPDGVDRWFAKPVNPKKIVEAIHQELATNPALV